MATNYPGSLDDFATTSPSNLGDDDSKGRTHSERHNDMESAMEAVQAELGTDPAGAQSTVKARLDYAAYAGWTDIHWPQTGLYYRCGGYSDSTSTLTLTANRLYYYPFWVPSTTSLAALAVSVYTEVAGNVRMGLYSATAGASGLVPSSLVVDAGTASTGTPGRKDITTTQSVTGGTWYFVAMVSDATATLYAALTTLPLADDGNTSARGHWWYESFTYAALPASAGTLTSPTTNVQKVPVMVKL